MWKWPLLLVVFSAMAAACAPQEYQPNTPAVYLSAAGCLQSNQDNLYTTGGYAIRYLTVATGDPAVPPWWEGGTTDEHPDWTRNDPYLGRGYEGAVTFEIAERLGFSDDDVRFVAVGFDESLAPGDKDFDFALQQIASLPERREAVDFSQGYYEITQALVSVRGSPIAAASSLEELEEAMLGAPIGTASLKYIEDRIQPRTQPSAYEGLDAAVRGLKDGQVEGIVVDLPSATFVTQERIPNGVIVGRLPPGGSRARFAMAFEKGSPIVECVNLALDEMRDDGTLDEIRREWLADATAVPLLEV